MGKKLLFFGLCNACWLWLDFAQSFITLNKTLDNNYFDSLEAYGVKLILWKQ